MKYKQEEKQTKYDYALWYGFVLYQNNERCTQVRCLMRKRPVATREESNCISRDGQRLSVEQLTFGSRKAAARYIRKHWREIKQDYGEHRGDGKCTHIFAYRYHCQTKQPLRMCIRYWE